MSMDPPADGPGAARPYPVPEPLAEALPEAPPPRPSAADLLPPSDAPVHRARRAGRRPPRRTWPQRLVLTLLVVGVVAAAGGAGLIAYGLDKFEQIERVAVALAPAAPGAPENFLVVGSDTRDGLDDADLDERAFVGDGDVGSGQRSDTIMVVRVDPAAESLAVLSLPRDLWLPIAGTDHSQRINSAYGGGPQRLVDTIEENFAIPIHHYVEVDFAGFAGLVEAIGGVPMWFDTPMRDVQSGLDVPAAGCHVLDPQMALAYARARNLQYRTERGWQTDGTADLGRITRQQVFLRRSLDQVGQLGITDARTLNRLVDVGIDSVTLDPGLGLDDILELSRRFATFEGDGLETYALPVYPWRTSGGASVVGLEEAEAQPILNRFRGLPIDTIFPAQVEGITVLNGTGETGQAGLVADALEALGFGVDGVGDVEDGPLARTRIRHASGSEAAADLVERHLTAGADIVVDATLDEGEIVLEIGLDFTTIGRRARPPAAVDPATTTTTEVVVQVEVVTSTTATTGTTATTEPIGVAPDPSATCN